MSHFAILVIGGDHDAQLAPYHEFECTGVNDEFVVDVDQTADVLDAIEDGADQAAIEEYIKDNYGYKLVPVGEEPDTDGEHQAGYYQFDADGKLLRVVDRTNPDAKWDGYVVGGRWTNWLKLKNGRSADQAKAGDVDWEGMRVEGAALADQRWDHARAIISDREYVEFEDFVKKNNGDVALARKEYWASPLMKDWATPKNRDEFGFASSPKDYLVSKEDYVRGCGVGATTLYAYVKDSEWISNGEMGWFGMGGDAEEATEWREKFNKMLEELDPEELVTVVDCHI